MTNFDLETKILTILLLINWKIWSGKNQITKLWPILTNFDNFLLKKRKNFDLK